MKPLPEQRRQATASVLQRPRATARLTKLFFRLIAPSVIVCAVGCSSSDSNPPPNGSSSLLQLLQITPDPQSVDYVENKKQFQLHTLITEQRHKATWTLSDVVPKDVSQGLNMLFTVDDDITSKLASISQDQSAQNPVKRLRDAVKTALLERKNIYVYGCGATGRLAKEMESTFWRPFWGSVLADQTIKAKLPADLVSIVQNQLIGEMTGADRALISSLEGFEDLQLIGKLQLQDRGIQKGDLVIAVTEGGETSSVIGTILAAHQQWKDAPDYDAAKASDHLFFVYNNPDDVLMPFDRSRSVLTEPGITKVNLTTGPQAITGSTRMQATSSETFVIAHALQDAVSQVLQQSLSADDMARIGFQEQVPVERRLDAFKDVLQAVKNTVPDVAKLTELEADTYHAGHYSTYFAEHALITVFIDSTERSPTFRLFPLDTVNTTPRQSWIQVWTTAPDVRSAWQAMLGRPFRGLDPALYHDHFAKEIDDPYLTTAALNSLAKAGNDQQDLYDFSFANGNLQRRGPQAGDLGVLIAVDDEVAQVDGNDYARFRDDFQQAGAKVALIAVNDGPNVTWQGTQSGSPLIHLQVRRDNDPFRVGQQVGLKMLLNAHSTAVMTRLDKVVGNTMTAVSPTNLKLIGRATYLILSHVNDVLHDARWTQVHGQRDDMTYAEANAVLFDSMPFVKTKKDQGDQDAAEVAISIVRILESLRNKRNVSWDEALTLLKSGGLNGYLANVRTN